MTLSANASAHAHGNGANSAKTSSKGDFHIPSLDGLRAVSFMLVFLAHAGWGGVIPGGFGVTIFFFLSGYLITTLLRIEHDRTGGNSLRDFYLRRAFRILPPFYTVLALAIALSLLGFLPEPLRLGSVLAQLFHVTNYWFVLRDSHGFPAGTVVYWSLAVEEHFYLVFPFVFMFLQRKFYAQPNKQALVLLALCAAVLLWRAILTVRFDATETRLAFGTDTRIDSLLYGCVLAVCGNPMLDRWEGSQALWQRWLFPAGCAGLLLAIVYRAPWFRETLRPSLQGLSLIPVFVVAIRYPAWGPIRVLNTKIFRWFGLMSYSLYLGHQVVLFAVRQQTPDHPLLGVTLAFGLSVALAVAIHRLIEKPAARARKAWVTTEWLRAPAAPARVPAASTPAVSEAMHSE
jgi:peptidoglycan/LPS O-acetylase OafA/YrhL